MAEAAESLAGARDTLTYMIAEEPSPLVRRVLADTRERLEAAEFHARSRAGQL